MLKRTNKIIIITERIICSKILGYLETLGVKAYTIYQDISGQGERGLRSISGGLSRYGENIRIEIIIDGEDESVYVAEKIYQKYLHSKYAGIIYLENIRVVYKE